VATSYSKEITTRAASKITTTTNHVVFPLRPRFNEAVLHLLETGLIRNGGDVPTINSPMYISIIKGIQAQEGAGRKRRRETSQGLEGKTFGWQPADAVGA
jgi:hypothetical protein